MISLTLSEYLDLLWRYRDKAIISLEQKTKIESEDNYRALCHLEPGGNLSNTPLDPNTCVTIVVWTVWRRRDWDMAYEKWLQDKKNADIRVAAFNAQKSKIEELCDAMIEHMGIDRESAKALAESIVKKDKKVMAAMYGVEL